MRSRKSKKDSPGLAARLETRDRFGNFVYNFIFLPRGEPAAMLDRIRARLLEL